MILITGASGQAGSAVLRRLRAAGREVTGCDVVPGADVVGCDLRKDADVAALFAAHRFTAVIHLAAVLPSAFRADPIAGADVNLAGTLRLLRASMQAGVGRFIFGSSTSVYGSRVRTVTEQDAAAPDDPYGSSKVAIERVLAGLPSFDSVSLRIARILGPGVRNTGSAWRSRIFERPSAEECELALPFAPDAILSAIHVDDLAETLRLLLDAPRLTSRVYNAPVERLRADALARMVRGWRVTLGEETAGPVIDSSLFTRDFGFATRPLADYFAAG